MGPKPGPGRPDGEAPPEPRPGPARSAAEQPAQQPAAKPAAQVVEDKPSSTPDEAPAKKKRDFSGPRRRLIRLVVLVGVAVLAALALRTFVVSPYYIPSASMEPTLHGCPGCNDDRILVDKISYRLHPPRQTDIVVFDRPAGVKVPESVLIKRVVAVAGDTLSLRSGRVYIDGKVLREPYVRKQCGARGSVPHTKQRQWKIKSNQVFVMGDNRCNSQDSRDFGPISVDSIVGRAFVIYWPVGHLGFP